MKINKPGGDDWIPHNNYSGDVLPKGTTVSFVLQGVLDIGMVAIQPQHIKPDGPTERHKVVFIMATDQVGKDGKKIVIHEILTLSLHEKSKLYGNLDSWGKLDEVLAAGDTDALLGQQGRLLLGVGESKDGTKKFNKPMAYIPADPAITVPNDWKPEVETEASADIPF